MLDFEKRDRERKQRKEMTRAGEEKEMKRDRDDRKREGKSDKERANATLREKTEFDR